MWGGMINVHDVRGMVDATQKGNGYSSAREKKNLRFLPGAWFYNCFIELTALKISETKK